MPQGRVIDARKLVDDRRFGLQLAEKDKLSTSCEQMTSRLAILMGGRASEEIVFGGEKVAARAQSDIEQATKLARAMDARWCFSEKLGAVMYGGTQEEPFPGYSMAPGQSVSESTSRKSDPEVRRLVELGLATARRILTEKRQDLDMLATGLLEYETSAAVKSCPFAGRAPVRDTSSESPPSPRPSPVATAGQRRTEPRPKGGLEPQPHA